MKTCKNEFECEVKGAEVECAYLYYRQYVESEKNYKSTYFILPKNYTENQYADFLLNLDFWYDPQDMDNNIHGFIWFKDGSWSKRVLSNDCVWWDTQIRPDFESLMEGIGK
jgi:hypothetical protein